MVTRRALTSLVTFLSSKAANGFIFPACHLASSERRRKNGCGCLSPKRNYHPSIRCMNTERGVRRDDAQDPRTRARDAFSKLAKRGRSWKRLRHLVELACLCDEDKVRSIADVGCDHGLLSLGLAVSGRFQRVIGVDVSEQALNDGAFAILRHLESDERWRTLSPRQLDDVFPVKFVVGDGLRELEPGQADALCIAGMGVNTMIGILEPNELMRVGCQFLVLQPTNSRPRNLMRLYDILADSGWIAKEERIEVLSSRWYLSALFTRKDLSLDPASGTNVIPGELLGSSDETYRSYVDHHRQWIERDSQNRSALLDDSDRRWLASVQKDNKR